MSTAEQISLGIVGGVVLLICLYCAHLVICLVVWSRHGRQLFESVEELCESSERDCYFCGAVNGAIWRARLPPRGRGS